MKITWADSLDVLYGMTIAERMVPIWEEYLKRINTDSEEIRNAVEAAAKDSQKPSGVYGRVTYADLEKWVLTYRRIKRTETSSGERQAIIDGIVANLKTKVTSGASRSDIGESIEAEQKRRPWIDTRTGNEIAGKVMGR